MSSRVSLIGLCLLLTSTLAVKALQDSASASEKDRKALQGKWEVVSVVADGKERKSEKAVVTFEGGNLTFTPKMGDFSNFSFTLDASKTPKALNLKSKDDAAIGIYQVKGNDLKICLTELEPVDKNRPKEFAASKETVLMVLKRVKK